MDKNVALNKVLALLDNLYFDGVISSSEYHEVNNALRVLIQEDK